MVALLRLPPLNIDTKPRMFPRAPPAPPERDGIFD